MKIFIRTDNIMFMEALQYIPSIRRSSGQKIFFSLQSPDEDLSSTANEEDDDQGSSEEDSEDLDHEELSGAPDGNDEAIEFTETDEDEDEGLGDGNLGTGHGPLPD